jgi:thioredoxin-like negative regulator of GroEL
VRVLLAVLLLAATAPAVLTQAGGQAESPKRDRVELLTAWLEAVDAHRPGAADDSVRLVATWSQRDLQALRDHVPSLISLIREPELVVFLRDVPGSGRVQQLVYSVTELRGMRALADAYGAVPPSERCPRDPPDSGRGVNGANALLKRAAMLHLDVTVAIAIGVLAPAGSSSQSVDRQSSFMVRLDDGQSMGTFGAAGHLELGRELLGRVAEPCSTKRAPARDPWVRNWYAVSLAHQLSVQQFEVLHVSRAVEMFRDDADILALGGASHEALSSPVMQSGVGENRDLRDRLQLRSASGELGRAEDLLRQALRRDAGHAEARLRLGNVLGLRGRHAEAIRELERAVAEAGENRLLAFYARLLHGRELEASGRSIDARAAYQQAARLFPTAQTPRIALSQLLRASGDASAAGRMLERLVDEAGDDPWWEYYGAAGRSFKQMVQALGAATPAAVRP